jgi:hypothetical protein
VKNCPSEDGREVVRRVRVLLQCGLTNKQNLTLAACVVMSKPEVGTKPVSGNDRPRAGIPPNGTASLEISRY